MFDFSIDQEFQAQLDWTRAFVDEHVTPLESLFRDCEFLPLDETRRKIIEPLRQQVRDRGLWAAHLGPELGGQGMSVTKLALLNEILGRVLWASLVFGTQAPDTGNAEILSRFGTAEQKERYLRPLLDGDIFSCFSMTEPQGGSDPRVFTTVARRDGDEWVLDGLKYWSSNASVASVFLVLAITDPEAPVHQGTSMFVLPADTPGVRIEAVHNTMGSAPWASGHSLVRYEGVRLPADAMLGEPGTGFHIAQARLAGGRIHHAMRAVGMCQRAIDMMCERALSRYTAGSALSEKQFVQGYIADSYTELMAFRWSVRYVSWLIDTQGGDACRREIAALKISTPKVIESIVRRAIQVHGGLGTTDQLSLASSLMAGVILGLADGPTEIHKLNLARNVLKDYTATDGMWPSDSRPSHLATAAERYAGVLPEIPPPPPPSRAT